jgi:LmbE family N-acetylglucosaminyl deacetylase
LPPGLKARAGSAADALLQAVWSAGFAALARLRPRGARLWSAAAGGRVLVVAPHPDDDVAGCAGTLLRHRLAGDAVVVAVATDGRRSRALDLAPGAMAARRREEALAAARRMDVDLRWIGLPEGEWSGESLRQDLRAALAESAPTVVYAPSPVDFHPEHLAVARALAAVLEADSSVEVRAYSVQVPLTAVLVNLVSPVGSLLPNLAEAIEAHASQVVSLRRCLRIRAYVGRRHGLGEPAEGFWAMTAAQYRRLHAVTDDGPRRFRGLRYHAATDPLAYSMGRRARVRLLERASGGRA